ncbi:TIGR01777 family oxidoreductase [Fluviicola chungangensis]|uniref:TIGR01777 family protein n=1 Tax=Fluviicola chungangensis TaxID=2597671 RepID=A0A556MJE4_9FLAO|nr:TIGR01777 family oxidoreductase [Fluviicola chungangensis]TSJ39989.1 TIGR01777 family protein [Fluviicola chungangensis]
MEKIVIAGGSGLIGTGLANHLRKAGHEVWVLSRKPSGLDGFLNWDPKTGSIDPDAITKTTVLINLCGAELAAKRWTKSRIRELYSSRVETTNFLFESFKDSADLKQYVSASGAVAYGFEHPEKIYKESDSFGKDIISDITRKWEKAADQFASVCTVSKIRIAVVLSESGGALQKLANPVKKGFGAVLSSGEQAIPWIYSEDLYRVFEWVIAHKLEGVYHASAGNTTNKELTKLIARTLKKRLLPAVPAFAVRLLFGKMALMLLHGNQVSNEKIHSEGFSFLHGNLNSTIQRIFG